MTSVRAAWLLPLALCACGQRPQPAAADATPLPSAATLPPAATPSPGSPPTPGSVAVANDALPATATYVLPGEFAPDTGIAQLESRFGKDNVRIGDVPGAEGETSRGAILFPDDPARRAYVYFQDEDKLSGLQLVRVVDASSRWRLASGVRVGMPLSELVALNGKPIRFYGFDWDYGGTITDWRGGALQPAQGKDAIFLGIRLNHLEDAPDHAYPIGEGEFSSDDRHYPKLGAIAIVGEVSAGFPGEDDL